MLTIGIRDILFLCLCGILHGVYRKRQKWLLPLPPSLPGGWPIVGNALQLPLSYVHLFYQEIGRKLGSKMVYIEALGQPIIVVNDACIANDLLDKRSAFYSSRPRMPMFEVFVGALSLSMTYGLPVKRVKDPFIKLSDTAFTSAVRAAAPGGYMVNIFAFSSVHSELGAWSAVQAGWTAEKSVASESFLSATLAHYQHNDEFQALEPRIKKAAMQVFGAVTETTITGLLTFVLAMLTHPEIQRIAQEEVDLVVGEDRLPDFSDRTKLPYLTAVLKEVLRWNPVVPAGIPHLTTADDIYEGYYIPKGSIVVPNTYAMLHDEEIFPKPNEFNPERFIKDGIPVDDVLDPTVVATFGFGRRICPGAHIAMATLSIATASILSLFDILPELDSDNKPIQVKPEFAATSLVSEPLPFKCRLYLAILLGWSLTPNTMAILGLKDAVFLCFCGLVHLVYRRRRTRLLPLPPSLPGWPIVGNAFQLPLSYVHVFYEELGRRLGSKIIYVEALGQPIIIINDARIASDLLEKRSSLYSSRPRLPMLEVIGTDQFFGLLPYTDAWRNQRRMFHQHFSEKNLPREKDKALEFTRKGLLPNLYQTPQDFLVHINGLVGGIALSMTYGLPVKRSHDPLIHSSEEAFKVAVQSAAPGKYLVNILPFLKHVPSWMPGAQFKRDARRFRVQLDEILEVPFKMAQNNIDEGVCPESFVSASLEHYKNSRDYAIFESQIKKAASQVFGAASEPTIAGLTTFMLAMLTHPEVQRKAQEEVDSVVGADRLPDFSDRPELPYLTAVLKEVLRWNPITPTGIPHLTIAEDVYSGYYIPKGATIMANAYAMLHDDDVFPNPKKFNPDRFIKDGVLVEDILDPMLVGTFGFGRRACPGAHIALATLNIASASILSIFNILPALDDDGRKIEVNPEFVAASLVSSQTLLLTTMTVVPVNVASLKKVKNSVIGNPSAKKQLAQDALLIQTLIACLNPHPYHEPHESSPRAEDDALRIEAAHVIASLASSEDALATLLDHEAPHAFLVAVSYLQPTDSISLRSAIVRGLRSLTMAMADIAGPSQWGLKSNKSKIRNRAKDGLSYLFQTESLDIYLPLLTDSSTQISISIAQIAAFAVRTLDHRKALAEWLPPEDRLKEAKTRRLARTTFDNSPELS
ncbi:hypothetical protein NP233_g10612 [Leucocoprinus birnbaumii]|uniref:Cytochrome P450 n=1 Tax=Leucocoprinus birnbaumii TaxID=56174 RepID=A0AAD5VIC6_9AGAR|nr:hypothetical protein NP233_g10612 [Leucocoprinus birnbaumii]